MDTTPLIDDPYKMFAGVLPQPDYDAWHYIKRNLNDLHWFADQVQAASKLLDHCEDLISKAADEGAALPFIQWSYVAVRDAAINIYNFAQTMQAIHSLVADSPTISAHIDKAKRSEAGRLLKEAVPRFGLIRHSVGHAGELASTRDKEEENAFRRTPDSISTVMIRGVVSGRRYTATAGKKIVSYELTEAVAFALYAAASAMDDLFLPLAAFTRGRHRERRRSRTQRRREG